MLTILLMLAVSTQSSADPAPLDQAWSVLKDGIDNRNATMRATAVRALGNLPRNQKAQEWALSALADQNYDVRAEAATALGQMGAVAARPKLREALNDKEIKVVLAAANSLYLLKDPAAYDVFYALLTGDRKSTDSLMQSQLNMLRDRRAVEKLAFETGIGFVPFGGMTYEAWKTVMHDDTTPVRVAAVERLASDPDPKTGQALSQSCSDKKWQIRAASAEAIAKRGDSALLPAITPLLEDENYTVRSEAAATIIRLSVHTDLRRRSRQK